MKWKRAALALLLTAMAAGGIWSFLSLRDCSLNYRFENIVTVGDVEICPNYISNPAFASGFPWDGEKESISVTVLDTAEDCRVTKPGGYRGRGTPPVHSAPYCRGQRRRSGTASCTSGG